MAKIHALGQDNNGNYTVVLHTAIPAGNNTAGFSWQSVWIASGCNTTQLTEGTAPGNITVAEKTNVTAGTVIEIQGTIPREIVVQGASAVNAAADLLISEALEKLQRHYQYYGWTNG